MDHTNRTTKKLRSLQKIHRDGFIMSQIQQHYYPLYILTRYPQFQLFIDQNQDTTNGQLSKSKTNEPCFGFLLYITRTQETFDWVLYRTKILTF
jgi:hypothetical protein